MTVPINSASLLDIETEFGRSGQVSFLDLYAGGALVPNPAPTSGYQTGQIPTSGAISIGDFLGVRRTEPTQFYSSPGTYYLAVPAGITSAAYRIGGSPGGGGGGGKAGGGDSTDVSRGSGGAGGGGGGGGGAGQIIDSIMTFAPTPYLIIVIGPGGAGGSGGQSTSYNGSWRTGQDGFPGADGQYTYIYNAAGALLTNAAGGLGGAGGAGGSQGDYYPVPGGASGAGYPAGTAGNYSTNAYGLAGYTQTYTSDPAAATAPPGPNAYGGAGGVGSTPSGGKGGDRQDGVGANGLTAVNGGYAYVQLNGTSSIGGGFVVTSATNPNPSVDPGRYNLVTYIDPNPIPSTCFPAGSRVLMGDGSWKQIQLITVNDIVMGMNGPMPIVEIHTPVLGNRRLLSFGDGSLTWSEEHALWTRVDNKQWWWSANTDLWRLEVQTGVIGGLFDNFSIRESTKNLEWAHITGWKSNTIVEVPAEYNTQLYLPVTHGSPIIVQGYAVGAGVNQTNFDYSSLDWDEVRVLILNKEV